MGRLAVDLIDGAIQVADRLAMVAGRATSTLIDVTMLGMLGVASIGGQLGAPTRATDTKPQGNAKPQSKIESPVAFAMRRPLARSP